MILAIEHVYDYQLPHSIKLDDAWLLVIDGVPTLIDEDETFVTEIYNKLH